MRQAINIGSTAIYSTNIPAISSPSTNRRKRRSSVNDVGPYQTLSFNRVLSFDSIAKCRRNFDAGAFADRAILNLGCRPFFGQVQTIPKSCRSRRFQRHRVVRRNTRLCPQAGGLAESRPLPSRSRQRRILLSRRRRPRQSNVPNSRSSASEESFRAAFSLRSLRLLARDSWVVNRRPTQE